MFCCLCQKSDCFVHDMPQMQFTFRKLLLTANSGNKFQLLLPMRIGKRQDM